MQPKTMGEYLKQARKAKGMTQEELAKRINIKRESIAKYERDIIQEIPIETREALAAALDIKLSSLLTEKENELARRYIEYGIQAGKIKLLEKRKYTEKEWLILTTTIETLDTMLKVTREPVLDEHTPAKPAPDPQGE